MDRRVDELGRIVIPSHMRRAAGLETKTAVKFELVDGGVLLTKARPTCIICNGENDLTDVKGKYVCRECKAELLK